MEEMYLILPTLVKRIPGISPMLRSTVKSHNKKTGRQLFWSTGSTD
jgi:hypothetical protein